MAMSKENFMQENRGASPEGPKGGAAVATVTEGAPSVNTGAQVQAPITTSKQPDGPTHVTTIVPGTPTASSN